MDPQFPVQRMRTRLEIGEKRNAHFEAGELALRNRREALVFECGFERVGGEPRADRSGMEGPDAAAEVAVVRGTGVQRVEGYEEGGLG
jgi:hypothetical protein